MGETPAQEFGNPLRWLNLVEEDGCTKLGKRTVPGIKSDSVDVRSRVHWFYVQTTDPTCTRAHRRLVSPQYTRTVQLGSLATTRVSGPFSTTSNLFLYKTFISVVDHPLTHTPTPSPSCVPSSVDRPPGLLSV